MQRLQKVNEELLQKLISSFPKKCVVSNGWHDILDFHMFLEDKPFDPFEFGLSSLGQVPETTTDCIENGPLAMAKRLTTGEPIGLHGISESKLAFVLLFFIQ